MLWLDETGGPVQVAWATYVGDEKLTESNESCGPFDTARDALDVALHALPIQLTLL